MARVKSSLVMPVETYLSLLAPVETYLSLLALKKQGLLLSRNAWTI